MFSGRSGKFREIVIYLMYYFSYLMGNILCMFGIAFFIWFFLFLTMRFDIYGAREIFY